MDGLGLVMSRVRSLGILGFRPSGLRVWVQGSRFTRRPDGK